MAKSRETTKKIKSITGGLVTTATDLVIITAAFAGGLPTSIISDLPASI